MAERKAIWVIEVTWEGIQGKPSEPVAITTGGLMKALILARNMAKKLDVPQSWVAPVIYERRADPPEQIEPLPAEVMAYADSN